MRLLIILLLISGIAYAEQPRKKRIHVPPNCMIIGGQLRCWVIDPLPTEE
jgi:hypothetical protein